MNEEPLWEDKWRRKVVPDVSQKLNSDRRLPAGVTEQLEVRERSSLNFAMPLSGGGMNLSQGVSRLKGGCLTSLESLFVWRESKGNL